MIYEMTTGDHVAYRDDHITIIYRGGIEFIAYRTDGMYRFDTFKDSAVLMESTPEGCARYYAKHYYGLEDLEELDG